MNNKLARNSKVRTEITSGSIYDVAHTSNMSIAEALIDCEVIVMFDRSSSMDARYRDTTRYGAAIEQLRHIQREHPGKVAVIQFSSEAEFKPNGVPDHPSGGTSMCSALDIAQIADGTGMKFFMISDGAPTDGEDNVLRKASQFQDPINTVFIGENHEYGANFMRKLASGSYGIYAGAIEANQLAEVTVKLLEM